MGAGTQFESLEYQFLELIGEFRSVTSSEARLRAAVRAEATRAETAEAALAAAVRNANEASNGAAAASAGASHATGELAAAVDLHAGVKMQLELAERQRTILEKKCAEMLSQIKTLEKELEQLRPLQSSYSSLQRQYTELHERISAATQEARGEASRLESELRRVEKCASGGSEIRERARLAAAAHARERRLASAELQHNARELLAANAEISKLSAQVAELQLRLTHEASSKANQPIDPDAESIAEIRDALEAERAGTEKLEKALAAALADNATLAAQIHNNETSNKVPNAPPSSSLTTYICSIDSFLAE